MKSQDAKAAVLQKMLARQARQGKRCLVPGVDTGLFKLLPNMTCSCTGSLPTHLLRWSLVSSQCFKGSLKTKKFGSSKNCFVLVKIMPILSNTVKQWRLLSQVPAIFQWHHRILSMWLAAFDLSHRRDAGLGNCWGGPLVQFDCIVSMLTHSWQADNYVLVMAHITPLWREIWKFFKYVFFFFFS